MKAGKECLYIVVAVVIVGTNFLHCCLGKHVAFAFGSLFPEFAILWLVNSEGHVVLAPMLCFLANYLACWFSLF